MPVLPFACSCGQVAGTVDVPSPRAGNHVTCFCPDCRASAIRLGKPDPVEGVEIWQTTPDRVKITQGHDKLAIQRLSPKGLMRWYATCCDTPMLNTLAKPRLAFAGILAATLSDTAALGPLIGRAFMPGKGGKPYTHEGYNRIGGRIVKMMALANLSGKWRETPFFDASGTPTAPIHVLTREERAAATPPPRS